MTIKIWEVASIALSALVGGMYWGPWLALTRSLRTFPPEVFLPIVHRMNRNMASLMTFLVPVALVAIIPVLFLSYGNRPLTFYLTLAGFALFLVALAVTVMVEVPIVKQVVMWTVGTLPGNWQERRDRWGSFHIVRVVAGFVGLLSLLAGAIL